MAKKSELAKRLRGYKAAGLNLGHGCVVAEGVFFSVYRSAQIAAKKYGRDLERVSGPVSGWLMKNNP